MRHWLRALLLVVVSKTSANAATLLVVSNKSTYGFGETVTLLISGNAQGASATRIFGRLLYNGARVDNGTRAQRTIGSGWLKNSLEASDTNAEGPTTASSEAFDQMNSSGGFQTAVNPISTVTLITQALGVVNVNWDTTSFGFQLNFFGLTSAPGTSFTIRDDPVPEPTTAALVALGLLALAASRRRA